MADHQKTNRERAEENTALKRRIQKLEAAEAEREQAEELIRIRLTLLEFAATHSLDELLKKTLDEVGMLSDSPIGFYHFVDKDQKTLVLQEWSTRTIKEFCKVKGKGMHYGVDQAGVWVDCVREKRPVIHNDYNSLLHRKGLPEGHAPVMREMVVPVMRDGNIVAILGVGNKPTEYTDKDIEIVSNLADVTWDIIERKQFEEALRESEENYRQLAETAHDWIAKVDLDFGITYVNRSVLEFAGFDPVGRNLLEFTPPEFHDLQQAMIQRRRQGFSDVSAFQWDVISPGDRVMTFDIRSTLLTQDGKPTGVMFIARDISDRKRADKALRESESKYKSLTERMNDVLWTTDLDLKVTYVSPSIEKVLGFTVAERMNQSLEEQLPPESLRLALARLADERAFDAERDPARHILLEVDYYHKDGSVRCLETALSFIRDERQRPVGIQGMSRDITDYKQIKKELTESEERHRRLFETMSQGVIYQTADGSIISANPAAETILGLSDAFLGQCPKSRIHYTTGQPLMIG